jgi:hypothetical protein
MGLLPSSMPLHSNAATSSEGHWKATLIQASLLCFCPLYCRILFDAFGPKVVPPGHPSNIRRSHLGQHPHRGFEVGPGPATALDSSCTAMGSQPHCTATVLHSNCSVPGSSTLVPTYIEAGSLRQPGFPQYVTAAALVEACGASPLTSRSVLGTQGIKCRSCFLAVSLEMQHCLGSTCFPNGSQRHS